MSESLLSASPKAGGDTMLTYVFKDCSIVSSNSMSGGKGGDNTFSTFGIQAFSVPAGYGLFYVKLTNCKGILNGGSITKTPTMVIGVSVSGSFSRNYIGPWLGTFNAVNTYITKDSMMWQGISTNSYGLGCFGQVDVETITVGAQMHTGDGTYYSGVKPAFYFDMEVVCFRV